MESTAISGVQLKDKNAGLKKVLRKPRNTRDVVTGVNHAMDLGSTGTRVLQFSLSEGVKNPILEIGSEYKEVTTDISHVLSKSDELVDNMELVIEDVTPNKENKQFDSVHIVKANMVKDIQGTVPRTSSSTNKTNQKPTYVNAIASIATRILITAHETAMMYKEYDVDLTVSLPPADTQSRKTLDEFKSNLAGMYNVTFPRVGDKEGTTIRIRIREENILVEEESLAVLRYWATVFRQDLGKYKRALVFDGGGRSFDIGCIEDGRLRSDASSSTQFGANRMQTTLAKEYVDNTGANKPNISMVEEAVQTGFMQKGNTFIPVTKELTVAKTQVAKELITHLNEVFDGNEDLSPDQINLILVAGGAFGVTGIKDEEGYVPSLMAFLKREYAGINSDTKFSKIEEDYPIPYGLAYYRISKGQK